MYSVVAVEDRSGKKAAALTGGRGQGVGDHMRTSLVTDALDMAVGRAGGYAFDAWMAREFPDVPFERYVDDAVVHCVSERQAHRVASAISERMVEVGLRLHPEKTRIVYCKDSNRRGSAPCTVFTFLGYTFQPRDSRNKAGVVFTCFLPAISKDALKKISSEVRSWRIHLRTGLTFSQLARVINPIVQGWFNGSTNLSGQRGQAGR